MPLRAAVNPSIRACCLVRVTTVARGVPSLLARRRLISRYSIDVAGGAVVGEGLRLPHPVGIVIGDGVIVGDRVTIYHHVTIGAGRGGYPRVDDDATVFPGSVLVGGIVVGCEAVVGANCFVEDSIPPRMKLRGGSRWP